MSNLFVSFTGVFLYFATLAEVPTVQSLLASGVGKSPALALLLAYPSLSLPNMLVILGLCGNKGNSRLRGSCHNHGNGSWICIRIILLNNTLLRQYHQTMI
ncbi:MAG: permease [Candidatus Aphodosoma sp.]